MNILIVGGAGGIGQALLQQLHEALPSAEFVVTHFSVPPQFASERIHWVACDIRVEQEIIDLAALCKKRWAHLHLCVNTVGMLHDDQHQPEKTMRRLTADFFLQNIQVNTLPTLLLAKHLNNLFDKSQPAVFATVSAKVGSIEDNQLGGWYSYRCSKAALNMALKTLSIEWQRQLPQLCVAALHPGTTVSKLSEPFTARLSSDRLFSPQRCARQLMDILLKLRPEDTGKFWSWDGSELPW